MSKLLKLVFVGGCTLLVVYVALCLYVISFFSGDVIEERDCILVFGAAVHPNNRPGPGIRRRVQAAKTLYQAEEPATLFLSGGIGYGDSQPESAVMRNYAVSIGIDSKNIITESKATSTWENLAYSKPLLSEHGCNHIVAVSDRYHLARIKLLADLQGWGNLMAYPAQPVPKRLFEVRAVLREGLGIGYYSLLYIRQQFL